MRNNDYNITDIPVNRFYRIQNGDAILCHCCRRIAYPEDPTDRIFEWACYSATRDDFPYIKVLYCEDCLEHFRADKCPHVMEDSKVTIYSRFKYGNDQYLPESRYDKLSNEDRLQAILRFFGPDPSARKRDRSDNPETPTQLKKNCIDTPNVGNN